MKKILCMLLALVMLATAGSFSAFAAASTRDEKAAKLSEFGLFYGTEKGYELGESVTRAQAVTMVLRYVGVMTMEYNSAAAVFDDVDESHWADGYIGKAVKLGIAKGTTEKTFEPEKEVSLNEFITFILRAIGYTDATLENCQTLSEKAGINEVFMRLAVLSRLFNRGDMVEICWDTLSAVRPDGIIVRDYLGFNETTDPVDLDMTLFQKIQLSNEGQGNNFMFSPFSIKMAFMMAANGADGETKAEILSAFGITDLDAYNENAKKVIAAANANEDFKLNVANSIWLNTDFYKDASPKFADAFKQKVSGFYNAEAAEVNNANAVQTINDWISKQTNDKIKNMLSDPNFLAALVNAIYFKADWQTPFTKEATVESGFTDINKCVTQTDFMQQKANFEYFEDDRFQMLNMPYKGSDISMYVFLPKDDTEINADDIKTGIYTQIETSKLQEVYVKMPKFKTEFSVALNDIMTQIGIKKAFDLNCMDFRDVMFSDIPKDDGVFIDKVLHKSFIEVDEKGTEAAAATAIIVAGATGMPQPEPEPKRFIADHPFVYIIRDNASGEVLSMGQYVKTGTAVANNGTNSQGLICPNCGSSDTIPILYGLPGPEMMEKADKGEIKLGGCVISESDPAYYCKDCEKEFGKRK